MKEGRELLLCNDTSIINYFLINKLIILLFFFRLL